MKKAIGLILASLIVISCIPFCAFASEAEVISGVGATISCDGADNVEIGGMSIPVGADVDFEVKLYATDASSTYSAIYLNNVKVASLVDGENIVKLNTASLKAGENELTIMLGTDKKTYTALDVYGSANIDDTTIESVKFNGAGLNLPSKIRMYMPIVGSKGVTAQIVDYREGVLVGDGWFQDTGLGGSTPNNPVMVGYLFEKPDMESSFIVDTTKLDDGTYTATFSKDGSVVATKEYVVDNTAPQVIFSVPNGANVSRLDKISFDINDVSEVKTDVYVDSTTVTEINAKDLSLGAHSVYVVATDAAGNVSHTMLDFKVVNKLYAIEVNNNTLKMSVLGDASLYSADLIKEIRMYENRYGELDQDYLRSSDEVLVSFNKKSELETKAIGDSVPYQSFVVNTSDVKGDYVTVSYTGTTGNGSDILLKAWNYVESRWDEIGATPSGVPITVSVEMEKYSYKSRMRVNVTPDIVYNGSDTIVWNSDTQYYSRYSDLNYFYDRIAQYTVEQYNAGNIGYYVHTGDLIDQAHMGDEIANAEYAVADKAQAILDKANVPNGVVSGNHDICHDIADYSYYWKYFGEDRYKDFDWYGGSLNNNMHHYDLVSIGAHDFVFLYIGNFMEDKDDTIAWASAVCEAYPTRNVIVCTHEYILPSGEFSSERSKVMWEKIVVPNENVIMVLCGHNAGVCDQMRQVGDSDRYVLEILADYQFSELGVGPQHVENSCTCDGEGFVRLMSFNEAGQMISTTYSPVASDFGVDPYNFYPSYADSFVYDLELVPSNRSICTSEFNVVGNSKYIAKVGEENINLKKYEAFYAVIENNGEATYSEVYVLDKYKINYIPGKTPEYKEPEYEKVAVTGHPNVSENFRMNEENALPDSSLVEQGISLIPDNTNQLVWSSGSNQYTINKNDNGSYTLCNSSAGGVNWVTLIYRPFGTAGKPVDTNEYDRIYFGVTADKNTKWNLSVQLSAAELDFARNSKIASQFGYVNALPSDITGTWNGYIDLKDFNVSGTQMIYGVNFVTATPDANVTFDYIFLGKSNGQKVRFVTDDTTVITYEALNGESVVLPENPYKMGYEFDGWYTEKEGGTKIEGPITVGENTTSVYARFTEKALAKRDFQTFDTEVSFTSISIIKVLFVSVSVLFAVFVVIVLMIKIKKTKKKGTTK